jgi:hypothetical protein
MKKAIFSFCILVLVAANTNAQSTNTYLNNYVQPAPNVAALGKYVDYPVSYYTGVPSVSVPIYDLKDGSAKVPVSLTYHPSGIRVSEVASWVGLGWALNAGGMITRSVHGAPDEGTRKSPSPGPAGYYLSYGLSQLPLLPHPVSGTISSSPDQFALSKLTVPGIASGSSDTEPDLFTFNFNGYQGKFVFDENRTVRLLTDDNLIINVNFDNINNQFVSWVITTPDGADYYFGDNNMHEVTVPHSNISGDDPDSQLPSSWFLTKIVYPNTKDTVTFSYSPETYTYFDLGPESETYNFSLDAAHSDQMSQVCDIMFIKQNVIRTTVNGLRLTKIASKNDSLVFVANTLRQDLANYTARPYRLDTIKVYTLGQCTGQFALGYGYFTSPLTSTTLTSGNLSFVNDSSDTKRLKLLSVQSFSGDKSLSQPPYVFQYQDTFQLPRRLSYDQDHWGYSNNSSGNANNIFTPPVNWGTQCTSGGGASREASWPQMEAGALLSVKNPLGVLTKFEFEANVADNYYPTYTVGGLRVKKIYVTDSVTNSTQIRKFQYSGGGLYRLPKYLMPIKNEYLVEQRLTPTTGYIGYTGTPIIAGMVKQSQSIVPLQDYQGNSIGYWDVQEIFGNNGEGGYKEYHFARNIMPNHNARLDISNYAAVQSVNSIFYGTATTVMGTGHFNDILPETLKYYNGYDVDEYYPAAPYQVEFTNGSLLDENTYDANGNLLQTIQNKYTETYHENYQIRGMKAFSLTASYKALGSYTPTGPTSNIYFDAFMMGMVGLEYVISPDNSISIDFQQKTYSQALTFYKLHTGVAHLASSIETVYKDGKQMVSTKRYGFESAYHTLKTSDTTVNSQGDSLISKTYYSFDYANGITTDSVVKKMKARNMLVPVATRLWKNHQLVSGTITLFKDFAASSTDTLINPYKIYALDVSNPLTTTQAGENIALTGQLTTLIPTSTYFHEKATFNYNGTTGKISEQNLTSDKKQALIWDNQYSLPLAVVDNANVADVAYNSFESAETGNWSFTSSSITADATTPLGAKVYVLGSSNPITKSGLTSGKKYILSYWLKSGGSVTVTGGTQSNSITGSTVNTSWTYKQVIITTTGTSISITGSGNIDEVRLYPATAQMVTYTYDGLLRLTDQCNVNSTISQYEYDSLNRLIDIKDQFGNVIKAFEYNYGSLSR